jgi:hypothetical protein
MSTDSTEFHIRAFSALALTCQYGNFESVVSQNVVVDGPVDIEAKSFFPFLLLTVCERLYHEMTYIGAHIGSENFGEELALQKLYIGVLHDIEHLLEASTKGDNDGKKGKHILDPRKKASGKKVTAAAEYKHFQNDYSRGRSPHGSRHSSVDLGVHQNLLDLCRLVGFMLTVVLHRMVDLSISLCYT